MDHRAAEDVELNQQGRAEKMPQALSEEYARFSAMNCWAVDTSFYALNDNANPK